MKLCSPMETRIQLAHSFGTLRVMHLCVTTFVHGISPRQGKFVARGCLVVKAYSSSCILALFICMAHALGVEDYEHMSLNTQSSHIDETYNANLPFC